MISRLSQLAIALILGYGSVVSAGEPIEIAVGASTRPPQQPQLAIDDAGRVHLVYGVGNSVYYVASGDGKTYSEPTPLTAEYVVSLGMRRGPRIAVTNDVICVSLIGGKQGKGRDGDVLAFYSGDHGKTWSDAIRVNDVPDAAREGLHAMAASRKGRLCCVWLDLRTKGTTIYAAESQDGGKSWSKNVLVYRSPSGTVCQCCHPSVVYGDDGVLTVMWRNVLDGNRDMYISSSRDGRTFSEAKKLGDGKWKLDACPMDGGNLAIDSKGTLFTAWRRDQEVFSTIGAEVELLRGKGMQPWCAATAEGQFLVWLDNRVGELALEKPGAAKPVVLAARASDPVIAANAKSGVVIAAWESHAGPRRAICCQVVAGGK